MNIDKILEKASLVEAHGDKYSGTTRANEHLVNTAVLLRLFKDGSNMIPVQFKIKRMDDFAGGKLYLTAA